MQSSYILSYILIPYAFLSRDLSENEIQKNSEPVKLIS